MRALSPILIIVFILASISLMYSFHVFAFFADKELINISDYNARNMPYAIERIGYFIMRVKFAELLAVLVSVLVFTFMIRIKNIKPYLINTFIGLVFVLVLRNIPVNLYEYSARAFKLFSYPFDGVEEKFFISASAALLMFIGFSFLHGKNYRLMLENSTNCPQKMPIL